MSVKLYLNNALTPYAPGTPKGAWDSITSTIVVPMSTEPFGQGIDLIEVGEATIVSPYSVLMLRGVSSKLQAQTISGTLDVLLGINETNIDAEFFWHIHAYVSDGNTESVRGVLLTDYTEVANEWPFLNAFRPGTGRALVAPVALNSVGVLSGDRIVVEIGYISRNVHTTNRVGTLWYGSKLPPLFEPVVDLSLGSTSGSSQAGTITFSQDILFESVTSQVAHVLNQVIDEVPAASSQIAHQVVQVVDEIIPAVARIAHILIQVAQGTPIPVVPGTDLSGIYTIEPNKVLRHDSYYQDIERKIPDPTIRTALIGE